MAWGFRKVMGWSFVSKQLSVLSWKIDAASGNSYFILGKTPKYTLPCMKINQEGS